MSKYAVYNWVVVNSLILLTGFILLVSFWLFYPYEPITYNTKVFPVLNKDHIVHAGEVLIYQSNSCRNKIGEIRVHRTLIDHSLIDFPDVRFYQDKVECKKVNNATLLIPTYAPTGTYYLEITGTMQVNPIRSVSSKIRTENFMVIGGDN